MMLNRTPIVRAAVETLESRRLLSSAPQILGLGQPQLDAFANADVPVGHTLQVPVTGFDADGDDLTYTVTSSNPAVVPTMRSTDTFLRMDVAGFGRMEFALFDDTPLTTRTIGAFADSGLYDGLTFHRVLNGFVNQGGDPDGNGSGASVPNGVQFTDEFDSDTVFTGVGQLAMANSGKDTNSTQFFITDTDSSPRFLDYNHTIFGQLTRGLNINNAISETPATQSGTPADPPVISEARTFERSTDGVIQLEATGAVDQSATITVTATDPTGLTSTVQFNATVVADVDPNSGVTYNQPPILTAPLSDFRSAVNEEIVIDVSAIDAEGDDFEIGARFVTQFTESQRPATTIDQANDRVIIQPVAGYTGPIEFEIGIKQTGATTRGSTSLAPGDTDFLKIYDTQTIMVGVGAGAIDGIGQIINTTEGVPVNDVLLATFTTSDANAGVADFTARVKWGNAEFDFGTITQRPDGVFEVRGSQSYSQPLTAPVEIEIVADDGGTENILSNVVVLPIAQIVGSRLLVNGTVGDDILGVSNPRDGIIRANVNNIIRDFSNVGIDGVELRAFDGNDFVSIGGRVPPVGVDGGDGDDEIYGGEFADFIDAGDGNDYVFGAGGEDAIRGQNGRDTLTGGAGKNTLAGGDGDDLLQGSGARDELYGGEGQDRLYGRNGGDVLDGGGGIDRIFAGGGEDLLIGGGANDRLYGEFGNDTLIGGNGRDLFSGGDGTDTAFFNSEDDLTVDVFIFSIEITNP